MKIFHLLFKVFTIQHSFILLLFILFFITYIYVLRAEGGEGVKHFFYNFILL